MIVVVEGVSAAGKTTWCQTHYQEVMVPEVAAEPAPAAGSRQRQKFWTERNADRWAHALALERQGGLAVCDGDPFKLHYTWGLWRIGEVSESELRVAVQVYRQAFAEGRLGLADLVLVSGAEPAELRRRRARDRGSGVRSRRRFELHQRLARPLREWYEAVDRLEPGRVRWELPVSGALPNVAQRLERSGADLFDALHAEARFDGEEKGLDGDGNICS